MNGAGGLSPRSRANASKSASVKLNQAPAIDQHFAVSKKRQGGNNHLPPGGQTADEARG